MSELSYVRGATEKMLIGQAIGNYFDEACKKYSSHEALVVCHQNIRLTYSELKDKVDALACGLLRLGLQHGDRIGIWSQNNMEWTVTQFAAAKAGLVLVTINPAYRRAELEYALNKAGCRALILSPNFKQSNYLQIINDVAPELAGCEPSNFRSSRLATLQMVIRMGDECSSGMYNFNDLLPLPSQSELERLDQIGKQLQCTDPINIQFTSGTTGNPKGATLSHRNILNNGYFVAEAINLDAGDRLCIPVPLYHCFGMVMGNLGCLTHGATMIYPSEAFDPESLLKTISKEKCTALYGVPTMFIAILDHPEFSNYDVSSLRTGIMAGSPCPVEVMKRVIDKMHMGDVTIAYGMTETSPVSFQSSTTDSIDHRVSTVGRVHPHCEVKIVGDDGNTVPRGVKGELCTRGYSVMLGYWADDEKTAEAIDQDGWMHTGDLATIDEHGYCKIVGRIKDMVIRGGENIYPREVEEFLHRHPKIREVQVIGVPDQKYGEELCALIILREGESLNDAEVKEFCKGQIAHYKVPRYIKFVEEFPMTVTGKVMKYKIRQQMEHELGLDRGLSH